MRVFLDVYQPFRLLHIWIFLSIDYKESSRAAIISY